MLWNSLVPGAPPRTPLGALKRATPDPPSLLVGVLRTPKTCALGAHVISTLIYILDPGIENHVCAPPPQEFSPSPCMDSSVFLPIAKLLGHCKKFFALIDLNYQCFLSNWFNYHSFRIIFVTHLKNQEIWVENRNEWQCMAAIYCYVVDSARQSFASTIGLIDDHLKNVPSCFYYNDIILPKVINKL